MWKSRGHRGDILEELIEWTHTYYHQLGLCRIDKVSTPVKVVSIDGQGMITKAFFEKKSTIDFIGIIQGVCVAFDAKETNLKSLPLSNIHEHQLAYMRDISKQGGLSFLIVHFKKTDQYFLLPYEIIAKYYEDSERKSIPMKVIPSDFEIKKERSGSVLNYMPILNTYLDYRAKDLFDA